MSENPHMMSPVFGTITAMVAVTDLLQQVGRDHPAPREVALAEQIAPAASTSPEQMSRPVWTVVT